MTEVPPEPSIRLLEPMTLLSGVDGVAHTTHRPVLSPLSRILGDEIQSRATVPGSPSLSFLPRLPAVVHTIQERHTRVVERQFTGADEASVEDDGDGVAGETYGDFVRRLDTSSRDTRPSTVIDPPIGLKYERLESSPGISDPVRRDDAPPRVSGNRPPRESPPDAVDAASRQTDADESDSPGGRRSAHPTQGAFDARTMLHSMPLTLATGGLPATTMRTPSGIVPPGNAAPGNSTPPSPRAAASAEQSSPGDRPSLVSSPTDESASRTIPNTGRHRETATLSRTRPRYLEAEPPLTVRRLPADDASSPTTTDRSRTSTTRMAQMESNAGSTQTPGVKTPAANGRTAGKTPSIDTLLSSQTNVDWLVDRLADELDRKQRIERERRGVW